MLLTNNNRSKAYIQCLIDEGFVPKKVIYLNAVGKKLSEHTENDSLIFSKTRQESKSRCSVSNLSFDEKESVLSTLNKNKIPYNEIDSSDPNDRKVIKAIKNLPTLKCIYSGPGGIILKPKVFETGKIFIHAHPGSLPEYRGSTTIYYSLLIDKSIEVSVIELNENIDEGDILHAKKFKFRSGSNLDYVVDPCVRAKTLIEFLKNNQTHRKPNNFGNTFYIIHPVLKHLAIIKNKAY